MINEGLTYFGLASCIAEWEQQANAGTVFNIDRESLIEAKLITEQSAVKSSVDALIYLCALNLLDAAINIPISDVQLSHSDVMAYAAKTIDWIDQLEDNSITYYYEKNKHSLYIQFSTIVFTFYEVPLTVGILKASMANPIQWQNISLQKIAQPLFSSVRDKYGSQSAILKAVAEERPDNDVEGISDRTSYGMMNGCKIGDFVEISIANGPVRKGEILSLEKQYVELKLENKKNIRIRYDVIAAIEEMDPPIDAGSLNEALEKIILRAGISYSSSIETNAIITMLDNKRVWLTKDTGETAYCFWSNIVVHNKEKISKGQRLFTFSEKDRPHWAIIEMTYGEFLDNFEYLTTTINDKTHYKRALILYSLTYLTMFFSKDTKNYSEIRKLEIQVKKVLRVDSTVPDDDTSEVDGNESTEKPIVASNPIDVEEKQEENSEIESFQEGETHKDNETPPTKIELYSPEVSHLPGLKVVSNMNLPKIESKKQGNVNKEITITSLKISKKENDKEQANDLLPANGTLISMSFGRIRPFYRPEQYIYFPAKEIIQYAGIIEAPQEGDKVSFSMGKNQKGPIAICVHKQCSRAVMEELIEKFRKYDSNIATRLMHQLEESEKPDRLFEYLNKVQIEASASYDEIEKQFADTLPIEEYFEAVKLLIAKAIADSPPKSYNLFLRSASYARNHGKIEVANTLLTQAIKTFDPYNLKAVTFFKTQLDNNKKIEGRIRITGESLENSILKSEEVFGPIPKYVKNEIISNDVFKGITTDKLTNRSGLYKKKYIDEVKASLRNGSSDDFIYLTLIKLELSFNPQKYNPAPDFMKFLVNRAKNIISRDKSKKYDEARYLFRLYFEHKAFVSFNDTITLYLMTLGNYSDADVEMLMSGQGEYKLGTILENVVEIDTERTRLELALMSMSNPDIAATIRKAYDGMRRPIPAIVEKLGGIYKDFKERYVQFMNEPIKGFKSLSEFFENNHILVGNEISVMNSHAPTLTSLLADFIIGDSYSKLKSVYQDSVKLIQDSISIVKQFISIYKESVHLHSKYEVYTAIIALLYCVCFRTQIYKQ